ncbi:hypothetical protein [Luteolibacter sp. Populi]|uniref:hypothetical protein n=1 Tax=Luteolibacter sp. Populi TaxID=3230487 RepID=UPI003464FCB9
MDLDPDHQAFIDAAMLPLGDAPASRELLTQAVAIAAHAGGPPVDSTAATSRLAVTARRFRMRRLLVQALMLGILVGVGWFTLGAPAWLQSIKRNLVTSQSIAGNMPRSVERLLFNDDTEGFVEQWMAERVDSADHLIALGGPSHGSKAARWKAVWGQHPGDPAHYLAYAVAYSGDHGKWPADFVQTGEELDPRNGWFRWLNASSRVPDVISPGSRPVRLRGGAMTAGALAGIKDEALLGELFGDWDRALAMPVWDDYVTKLRDLRMSRWPPAEDYPDHLLSYYFSYSHPEDRSIAWQAIRRSGELLPVAARHFAAKGDRPALDAVAERFLGTLRAFAAFPQPNLGQSETVEDSAVKVSRQIADAYGVLGAPDQASRFRDLADRLDQRVTKRLRNPKDALEERRGSTLARMSNPARITPVSEDDLRGGRLAEYAATERLALQGVALFLLLVLPFMLLAVLRERRATRVLGDRLAGVLEWSDHAWIFLLGLLGPGSVYWVSLRLPWLGFRDFSLTGIQFAVMFAVATGLALSVVLCSLEATRWRLSRRAAVAGFGSHGFNPGRWIAALALGTMPYAAAIPHLEKKWKVDDDWTSAIIWSPLALPLLWLLCLALGFFAGSASRRLHRFTLLRAASPFVAAATLLSAIAIAAVHAEERKWVGRIRFEQVNRSDAGVSNFSGSEFSSYLQGRLREALDAVK